MTARSWEHWIAHYEKRGFRVLAPAYPGFEVEVECLDADTTPIEKVTVPQIVESLETLIGGLDKPPVEQQLHEHAARGVADGSPGPCTSGTRSPRPAPSSGTVPWPPCAPATRARTSTTTTTRGHPCCSSPARRTT
ncbi:hypothetical protein [Streptomyces sp. NPDC058867]|uniref:hypothetical protein n=1 Tax=unclassified Streptomyces TaxID=2593676 RepID=UPI00369A5E09